MCRMSAFLFDLAAVCESTGASLFLQREWVPGSRSAWIQNECRQSDELCGTDLARRFVTDTPLASAGAFFGEADRVRDVVTAMSLVVQERYVRYVLPLGSEFVHPFSGLPDTGKPLTDMAWFNMVVADLPHGAFQCPYYRTQHGPLHFEGSLLSDDDGPWAPLMHCRDKAPKAWKWVQENGE